MSLVVTSEQMKRLDERTIRDMGIPSRVLMENAGKGCADILKANFDQLLQEGIVILCGPGNNGGDGYVLARWLDYFGYDVCIICAGEGNSSPETTANRELCEKLQLDLISTKDDDFEEVSEEILLNASVIIDAVYGIGFRGELPAAVADLMEVVNDVSALKVALDIPSGVNADTGFAELAFQADLTLTLETRKIGHLLGRGKQLSGGVSVVPIGIPLQVWAKEKPAMLWDESNTLLPIRNQFSHKGSFGRIAVFAGSPGYTGAAFMASLAALKAGAGLVTIFCHPDNLSFYNAKPFEVMVNCVPLRADGRVDIPALNLALEKTDVLLLGPGCGVSDYTLNLLEFLAENWTGPAVLDADGLNTLAQHPELLTKLQNKPVVLTPHWGEFCRLARLEMEALERDCITPLKEFADKYNLKVLLKSDTSVYYDGDSTFLNTTGNDGLATGGSGDVLAGLIAGFLAQGLEPVNAAGLAAYHLGKTAELMAEQQETRSITPTGVLDYIFTYPEPDAEDYTE
jgi:ADP-dependent NAD(P)H-hydrate dehydratase / NAD(P)H-hydrate epimerase